MKKRISILIALIVALVIALPVIAACETTKTVKSLDFVDVTKNYTVGDVIDYDSWKVKITYTDDSTDTKTVRALKADGATLVEADLSKEGNPVVTLTYKEQIARVTLTVTSSVGPGPDPVIPPQVKAFSVPDFYDDYVTNSKNRTGEETRGDFRVTGEIYEVGTANKFIFKPVAKVLDLEAGKEMEDTDPQTTVEVYTKATPDGTYVKLEGQELDSKVTVGKNTYKFSKDTDEYVKLVISLDESVYDLSTLPTEEQQIVIEFKLIKDGYNVYDQIGLSVMADLEKIAWSEIWQCNYSIDENNNTVVLTATEDTITLLADDEPICAYVGNITTVVLHDEINLDPTNMPSLFFWTDGSVSPDLTTSDMWTEAYQSLAGHADAQAALAGSLRNGANSGKTTDRDYMRVMDTYQSNDATTRDKGVNGNMAIETGLSLNMQKSFFATGKVSVSGNYQSIKSPARGERIGGRILEIYVDWESGTKVTDPQSHWAVFQMHQSIRTGAEVVSFEIRNVAFEGNNPAVDDKSEGVKSAGLLLCNSYTPDITFYNVNATQFFTNMLSDGYNEGEFHVVEGKITNDTSATTLAKSIMHFEGVKMYNSYSNMVYTWRSNAVINNCEFIGAGGPLFIMCDGPHTLGNPANTSDKGGSTLTVDSKSVLQSYAEGGESWYATYDVTALFPLLKQNLEGVLEQFGKTILFKSKESQNKSDYLNLIAVMICSTGDLLKGGSPSDVSQMLDPRGVFTQLDENGEIANEFALHNSVLPGVKAAVQHNATNFPLMAQAGNAGFLTDMTTLYEPNAELFADMVIKAAIYNQTQDPADGLAAMQAQQAAALSDAQKYAWATTQSNMLALYMSTGSQAIGTQWSPYFAVIVEMGQYSPQA